MNWRRETLSCVVCPACGFAFADASGPDKDGNYSCPMCALRAVKKRRAPPKKPDPGQSAAALAWRCWRELYAASGRSYGTYIPEPADGRVMERLAKHAEEIAVDEAEQRGDGVGGARSLTEALLRHWFANYLRDTGSKTFSLVDQRHALRFLERGIPSYGAPWSKPARSQQRRAPRPDELPQRNNAAPDPDGAIVIPPEIKAALERIGTRPGEPPRRR